MQGFEIEGERQAVIGPEAERVRLDRALAIAFPDVSRARLQELVKAGPVRRAGVTILDSAVEVGPGPVLAVAGPNTHPTPP
ncbi:hypothetical protein, partial [Escherichia coli]|uniref:hypothetical protein n=1 Tax=Escherichia coli TaxID=562 RepID=UPI0018FF2CB1